MDLYLLMVVRANSCKTAVDRSKFDDIFWKFYGQDSSLEVRITFNILGDKSILPVNVLSILYAQMFTPQVSEAESDEDDIYEDVLLLHAFLLKNFVALHYFGKG
jgi:hypothetical protein